MDTIKVIMPLPTHLPEKDSFAVALGLDKGTGNESELEYERDYSQMDLVDLIDQPAWKSILLDLVTSEKMDPWDIDVTALQKILKNK